VNVSAYAILVQVMASMYVLVGSTGCCNLLSSHVRVYYIIQSIIWFDVVWQLPTGASLQNHLQSIVSSCSPVLLSVSVCMLVSYTLAHSRVWLMYKHQLSSATYCGWPLSWDCVHKRLWHSVNKIVSANQHVCVCVCFLIHCICCSAQELFIPTRR